jgi:hypothetical protein
MPETMPFPPLYKVAENGGLIEWTIEVERCFEHHHAGSREFGRITTRWGQEGGKYQETRDNVAHGKNPGKSNSTTPYEQACKEAKSKWEKQQKARKYSTTREDALSGIRSDLVKGGYDCMLAFPIEKKLKHVRYPGHGQPKLDGHRCLAVIEKGKATLWSRTRQPINSMPHVVEALEKFFAGQTIHLDGELYNHDYHDNFQELTSLITSDEPVEGHEVVQYHIYDREGTDAKYVDRYMDLRQRLLGTDAVEWRPGAAWPKTLVLVETLPLYNEEDMKAMKDSVVAAGYEGLIFRNTDGLYVGKRSPDLLKVKDFFDDEFECIAVTSEQRAVVSGGQETMVEYPVFTVRLPNGNTTNAPMMGKRAVVQKYYEDPSLVVGKLLTVRYQGYTDDGKLRFPKCRFYTAL